jgi:hypothetical protein
MRRQSVVGFAAGPAGDAVAQQVEHLEIDLIGIALFHQQVGETVVVIIAVLQTQDRFS